MSTFQFDTSGAVALPFKNEAGQTFISTFWSDLTPFAQGYFTAIAREAWETLSQIQKDRLDHFGPIAFSDFSPELVGRGMRDCEAFLAVHAQRRHATNINKPEFGGALWKTRNDKHTGRFFEIGTDEAAKALPPLRLVIAEDGLLHAEERR